MGRPKRDCIDDARLKLWREEVFVRTGCKSFHEADIFLGFARKGADERPRFMERTFERDLFPSTEKTAAIAGIKGFEHTAELINSPMWILLRDSPNSIQKNDDTLRAFMQRENMIFQAKVEWDNRVSRYRTEGVTEARAYSIVVESLAAKDLKSDFSRLEFFLLNLFRAQNHRQLEIARELEISVDNALDRFFHRRFDREMGREFYQLAVDRSVGRSIPSYDLCSRRCIVFTPPTRRPISKQVA